MKTTQMFNIIPATNEDIETWFRFDKHISKSELLIKIPLKRCFILKDGEHIIGVMRYNMFWDNMPFLTMIYLGEAARGKGFGKQAMLHWENEMRALGFPCVMTSSQADENAQFFYRKLNYRDTGHLFLEIPAVKQSPEIFFIKEL